MDTRTRFTARHRLTRATVTGLLAISFVVISGALAHADTKQDCLNAVSSDWSSTETWIWRQLCANAQADLNDNKARFGPRPKMADASTWSAERNVSAAFLESVISDSTLTDLIGDRPIFLLGMRVPEAVDLSAANPKISIYLYEDRFDDVVTLIDTVFEKNLGLSGCYFAKAIEGSGLEIGGYAYFDDTDFASIDLISAKIGGSLQADGARFHGALGLSSTTIGNDLSLEKSSLRNADLSFAKISRNIVANGTHFTRDLEIDSTEAHNVFLYDADLRNVDISLATFTGFLDLSGSHINGDVLASAANVSGSLKLVGNSRTRWSQSSLLDLRGATVGDIEDGPTAWPQHLLLGGFRYSLIAGDQHEKAAFADQPVKWFRDWLHRDPTFSRATYLQLQNSLRELGRDDAADRIAMASKDRESSESSLDRRAVALLYKATVGYGYQPQRAIYAAILFIIIGALVARKLPGGNPDAPSKVMLSIQRFIPFLSFSDAYKKVDTSSSAVNSWVRRYFYVHTVVGYVLAAFLLAALSQLTKV